MEISVRELRIGNILERSFSGQSGIVDSLDQTEKAIQVLVGNARYIEREYSVKPIVITFEWLGESGFILEGIFNSDGDEIGEFWYHIKSDFVIKEDSNGLYYGNSKKVYLKYVHQLQNLYFALIGEELL